MPFTTSTSTNPDEYENLIRKRGESDYASYCPQLNFMIKGTEHEEVSDLMKAHIAQHIKSLSETESTEE